MSQVEIDHLMARFLEEETFSFVECIEIARNETNSSKEKNSCSLDLSQVFKSIKQ